MDATIMRERIQVNTPEPGDSTGNAGVPRIPIGERIRSLRQARNWSANELGRRAGVPQPTVSRIETGSIQQPKQTTVASIANAFGVTPADLWGEPAAARTQSPKSGSSDPLDVGLLTNCMVAVESELIRRGVSLSAFKRARVVAALYEHAQGIGRSAPDDSAFRRFMEILFD